MDRADNGDAQLRGGPGLRGDTRRQLLARRSGHLGGTGPLQDRGKVYLNHSPETARCEVASSSTLRALPLSPEGPAVSASRGQPTRRVNPQRYVLRLEANYVRIKPAERPDEVLRDQDPGAVAAYGAEQVRGQPVPHMGSRRRPGVPSTSKRLSTLIRRRYGGLLFSPAERATAGPPPVRSGKALYSLE